MPGAYRSPPAADGVPRCTCHRAAPTAAARGHPLGRAAAAHHRRAGLGAGRRGRPAFVPVQPRLGPAHRPDLAAALGTPDPGRAPGGGGPDPDPVRPLPLARHWCGPRARRLAGRRRRPDLRPGHLMGAASRWRAGRRSSQGPRRGSRDDGPRPGRAGCARCCWPPAVRASSRENWRPLIEASGGRAVASPGRPARPRPRPGAGRRRLATAFGRLDGVVLSAATSTIAPAEEQDPAAFDDVLRVNVGAQAALAAARPPGP